MSTSCPLCNGIGALYYQKSNKTYFKCTNCSSVYIDKSNYLDYDEERERYLEHNNDVNDAGYQNFVKPIIDIVTSRFTSPCVGLDFGAGTGPVISKILREKGYTMFEYDPYFHNYPELLVNSYDFIVCCEVIEHFNNPRKEFYQLRSMLNPGGELICMTDLYTEKVNFEKWYYKNDPTHVFFYHPHSVEYIAKEFNFTAFDQNDRLIRFVK